MLSFTHGVAPDDRVLRLIMTFYTSLYFSGLSWCQLKQFAWLWVWVSRVRNLFSKPNSRYLTYLKKKEKKEKAKGHKSQNLKSKRTRHLTCHLCIWLLAVKINAPSVFWHQAFKALMCWCKQVKHRRFFFLSSLTFSAPLYFFHQTYCAGLTFEAQLTFSSTLGMYLFKIIVGKSHVWFL